MCEEELFETPTIDLIPDGLWKLFDEENSLSTLVVPPVPKPVESDILAKNCNPAGSFKSKVYEYGWVSPEGIVILRMRPPETEIVWGQFEISVVR